MTKPVFARLMALVLIALMLPTTHAAAQGSDMVTYRVKAGDTLYNIARRYFWKESDALKVQRINRVTNPRRMPVNTRLRIPREFLSYKPVELKVDEHSGEVKVDNKPAFRGMLLGRDVQTSANGFVTFTSKGFGGRISVPSNSVAELVRALRYDMGGILDVEFKVVRGRGSASSPRMKRYDRLRMSTPVGTSAVRGTEFRVGYDEASARGTTEVTKGTVAVAVGGREKSTPAGFGVASTASGVGEQETLLPATALIGGNATQSGETMKFAIAPQDGAVAYRVQIGTDADLTDMVSETVVTDPEAVFDGLKNGTYSARVRAISATGLEGFDSKSYQFRRQRLGVAPEDPSPLAFGTLFSWLAAGEGETVYAFQLWNKDNPDTLIVDEAGLTKTSLLLTELDGGTYQWRVAVMQADNGEFYKVWGEPKELEIGE
ncbi:MAG: LysM peptidoglycan-binding domain-containing protein [Pseudomonadota bacterium]